MNVATILNTKGKRVVTSGPETSIQKLARRMALERIGASVVIDDRDRRIIGLLSEQDIVKGLADHGSAILTMRVSDLMTSPVRTCTPQDTLKHIMEIMTRSRIRHLPAVDEQGLCGIVSIGDVVKYRLEEMALEMNVLRDSCMAGRLAAVS